MSNKRHTPEKTDSFSAVYNCIFNEKLVDKLYQPHIT